MRKSILLLLAIFAAGTAFSQLAVSKIIGKYSKDYQVGYGAYWALDFPTNEYGSQSVVLELINIEYFPVSSSSDLHEGGGFFTFKAGYRYIFSEDSKTGFFLEPQAGFALTAIGPANEDPDGSPGKGLALALIAGYSLEVGQRGNNFIFGLKYETALAGANKSVQSVGLRAAFHYRLF
ncbi:MAG TPA: hypothetical protein VEB63_03370 [Chitinophagaceae bacterium]|nr:hypothetical protein [Chitinophagaceae bacterium]